MGVLRCEGAVDVSVVGAAIDVEGDVSVDAAFGAVDGDGASNDVAFKAGAACVGGAEVEGNVAIDGGAFEA